MITTRPSAEKCQNIYLKPSESYQEGRKSPSQYQEERCLKRCDSFCLVGISLSRRYGSENKQCFDGLSVLGRHDLYGWDFGKSHILWFRLQKQEA